MSRPEAIALLEQVQRFFRKSEPSSPIPMLCERARGMAERDFMSVLREVLPKAALKTFGAEK
jgi:type VI secretion system protein ImpA